MRSFPTRFCVVCTEKIDDLHQRENPSKARKCAYCKEAGLSGKTENGPHCVHCKKPLERGPCAWTCQPLCPEGCVSAGNPDMRSQNEEAKQLRRWIELTAPRPNAERRASARSRAVRLGSRRWRHQRLPTETEEESTEEKSGSIFARAERLRRNQEGN